VRSGHRACTKELDANDKHQDAFDSSPAWSPADELLTAANDASDDVLDVDGCAQLLRVGRNHVYTLAARNQIPHRRVGRFLRFSREAIMRWLSSCGPQVAQEQ